MTTNIETTHRTIVPSVARRGIVPLLMTIALVSHFNRVSMPAAGDTRIMKQYGIEPTQMGWVYSAFLLTYTLFMIPGGVLIDRFGARIALLTVCLGSAAFVALTGVVGLTFNEPTAIFVWLLVVRALMGVFSAPLHPGLARSVGHWVSPRIRSRTNGLVNGCALVGIAITPVVFGKLIDRFDWPASFLIAAVITALLGVSWALYASDGPGSSREDEVAKLAAEPPGAWRALFTHRSLMLLTLSYAAVGYFQYLFFYWMTYYFETVLKLDQSTSRFYAAIPPLAMAVGMPLGGFLSDRIEHARGSRGSRKLVPLVGLLAGALFLGFGVFAREPAWIVAWFALALGAVGMTEGPFWATAIELGGRRGGSSAGLFNTGGNAGGILAPIVTPWVGQHYGWGYSVAIGSLVSLIGVVLWLAVDLDERPHESMR